MFKKTIRIALLGTPADYRTSLLPLVIKNLGYRILWSVPARADLVIYGSFYDPNAIGMRWLPRSWRKTTATFLNQAQEMLFKRLAPPITLFHTAENLRHNHIQADFSISHDLGVNSCQHFRLPYWMEMIDWSHEGLVGNSNPRYGELIQIKRLQNPLGMQFLERAQKAVLISSHLREPRASCLELTKSVIPVDTMGSYFDSTIKDHHHSNFIKKAVLQNYAFNLCPENGLHPGYITEKIPEAFAAGCLPITYADQSVYEDFNPDAMINLLSFMKEGERGLVDLLQSKAALESYACEPLLTNAPSIEPFRDWVRQLLLAARS